MTFVFLITTVSSLRQAENSRNISPPFAKDTSMKTTPSTTGATAPKAAKSSDGSGERQGRIVNGIAMGKADGRGNPPKISGKKR